MSRIGKQIIIATIFLLILAGIFVLLWRSGEPEPTCVDGVRNQNETGVDCGGACAACQAIPEAVTMSREPMIIATSTSDQVEILFSVRNPNPQWGVVHLPYEIILRANGEEVARRGGSTYILPLEEHIVVEQAIHISAGDAASVRVEVTFGDAEFVDPPEGISSIELAVLGQTFTRNPDPFNAAEIRGVIRNDSPFSYDAIDIIVVVTDSVTNKVVSARRTAMRTLTSAEKREFSIMWREPLPLVGEPLVTVIPLTNIFVDENFLREFGDLERFQLFH